MRNIEELEPDESLTDQQKTTLNGISQGCQHVLNDLNAHLDKYQEIVPVANGAHGRARRVWKRLRWEQNVINDFRQRIASNIQALTLFLTGINQYASKYLSFSIA